MKYYTKRERCKVGSDWGKKTTILLAPKLSNHQALKPLYHLIALFSTTTSHPSIFGGESAVIHCSSEKLSVCAELSDCWALLGLVSLGVLSLVLAPWHVTVDAESNAS